MPHGQTEGQGDWAMTLELLEPAGELEHFTWPLCDLCFLMSKLKELDPNDQLKTLALLMFQGFPQP